MKEEVFIIKNIKVTRNLNGVLWLDDLLANGSRFASRDSLTEVASILLDRDKYQNSLVCYDGCFQFKSK